MTRAEQIRKIQELCFACVDMNLYLDNNPKDNNAIELAKEILEISYQKMKQNVTPKLTEELSKNIQKISNGKYTKISLHEEQGIIIEKENGEYAEAEKLSVRNNRPTISIFTSSNGKRTMQRIHANNTR